MSNEGFWGTRGQPPRPLSKILPRGCPLVPQKPSLFMDHFTFTFKDAAPTYPQENISFTRSSIFFCIGLFSISIVSASLDNRSFCSLESFAGTTMSTVT